MTIKIKPENRGKFNATKKKTGKSTEELTHSKNPVTKKRAIFAANAAKWNNKQLGGSIDKYTTGGWANNQANGTLGTANTEGNGTQQWGNLNTSSEGIGKSSSNVSAGQAAGYGAQAVQAISPLWTQSQYYTPPTQSVTNTVGNTVKGAASSIPIAGAFVQAGSQLGEGFQTGTNLAYSKIDKHQGDAQTNQHGANAMAFFKGMSDPISNYTSIADAKKKGLISTGDAVGMGLSHLIGGSGISEAILQKKLHQYNVNQQHKQIAAGNVQTPINQQQDNSLLQNLNNNPVTAQNGLRGISKYVNGGDGQLEQYNTGLHKNMPDNFANAQLDGKPIQLQRKENIYRFKDGGDYVFTDNLMNPETGNLFSKDANKVIKKSQKPFLDEASTKVINHNMKGLSKINDKVRGEVEQKSEFPMYAKNGGSVPKALNSLNGRNIPFTENQPRVYDFNKQEEPIDMNSLGQTSIQSTSGLGPQGGQIRGDFNKVTTNTTIPKSALKTHSKLAGNGNNLTTGDYLQLAGSAVAPIANIANYARKPEKVKAHLDNTQYSDPRIAKDFNPMYLAQNAATNDINNSTLSDAGRRAALTQIASNTQSNLNNYSLAVDNQNKALQFQRDQALAGTNRFNANQLTNRDTAQSQTNAVRRNYLNTGLAQAGQSLVDFGKMKNQGLTNNIELSTLNQLAADYGVSQETMKKLIADGRISTYFKGSKTGK